MSMMSRLNVWSPFGSDHVANAVAEAALQPAVELAAARRVYDHRPPRMLDAEVRQRAEVDRLGEIVDGFADSTNTDRATFRQMLERKLRRDHGGSPDLTPLPPRAHRYDDDRRVRLGRKLDTHARHEEAQRLLARAEKRTAACACTKLLALRRRQAETASHEYQQASAALAEYDRADGAAE